MHNSRQPQQTPLTFQHHRHHPYHHHRHRHHHHHRYSHHQKQTAPEPAVVAATTTTMAKPLLTTSHTTTNHNHHPPLITLTREEKSIPDRSLSSSSSSPSLAPASASTPAPALKRSQHHANRSHQELPPQRMIVTPTITSLATTTTLAAKQQTPTKTSDRDSSPTTISPSSSPVAISAPANVKKQILSTPILQVKRALPSAATTTIKRPNGATDAPGNKRTPNQSRINCVTSSTSPPSSNNSCSSGGGGALSGRSTVATAASATVSNGTGSGEIGNVTARLLDMGKRLLEAAREGQTDHVRQLVVSSGAPFTSDWFGTTALHLAAQYGHTEIAEILLRGGVNRDARTKLERTALHLAAQSGSLPVVESLLIHGSDINARDMLKMTPLHWAVERHHPDVVRRLLVGGADPSVRSKFQLSPLEIALNSGYYEIVELLRSWYTGHKDSDSDSIGAYDNNHHNHNNHNHQVQVHQVNNISNNNHNNAGNKFFESHDIFDVNYQLLLAEPSNGAASRGTSMLDIDEPCIDLVELEWGSLKFEADFSSHPSSHNHEDDDGGVNGTTSENIREQKPCELECLMKMVEELQKENEQLRKRLEQISTPHSEATP